MPRLNEVEAHCASVDSLTPPNPTFLEETLRGCVLHLSAHFQGFCRDLYTECSQIWIASIPTGLQLTAQRQSFAKLQLDQGNPSYDNIKRDFNRFGFTLDLQSQPNGSQRLTNLDHLNVWRNRAAHQGTQPLPGGVPVMLTLQLVQNWKAVCDELATSLDGVMFNQLSQILAVAPW